MKKTLLEQALELKSKRIQRCPTDEEIDLAIAWVNHEIGTPQAAHVLNMPPSSNIWQKMSSVLRAAAGHGKIEKVRRRQ